MLAALLHVDYHAVPRVHMRVTLGMRVYYFLLRRERYTVLQHNMYCEFFSDRPTYLYMYAVLARLLPTVFPYAYVVIKSLEAFPLSVVVFDLNAHSCRCSRLTKWCIKQTKWCCTTTKKPSENTVDIIFCHTQAVARKYS